jgi:hypothetical protein
MDGGWGAIGSASRDSASGSVIDRACGGRLARTIANVLFGVR